jgi:hypothetical protein
MASAAFLGAAAALVVALHLARLPKPDPAPAAQLSDSAQTPARPGGQRGQPTSTAPAAAASTDRDNPTPLTTNVLTGPGLGEPISYYYVFNAGPGTLRATVDGKNGKSRTGLSNAIAVELFDTDANELLEISLGSTHIDKRVVKEIRLGRQQQVIMRVRLDEATIDYKVRLEGVIALGPTPAK